ncbi:hypothetical protein E6P09_13970 [Haloferax mediterranei ATCC 33500]|uniref:DUF8159 domain-containing protein n=1 Tax=Haloferax mediterranei (strain ATCC 33500 / DSM 1411 / JCM 8866 / NBRC 14739 / NCIMB 2177 / R-4) TaxID=523841 RepID=I3R7N3_HALMT|nr:hypothetical protein [Haloferax mediterranei]AFK20243.1 hypothetical protein HFX_2562 [Haloferax mediterranei ATCC 33500]AHZ23613.1 hypothetical protein BM92_13615 [Haloferax mediterranei ATCC 33500]ELZ99098.1 hypothetical protein C439_14604 [Haloferax mediterranei ATCC 33500]MDX5987005.1 hypothetical protein [Haloferax mediterranei ATCC 33500]QCQ76322.1 hypothetical protein E6P09_13970 [Haloferax mediterranei ATCC 33500]
MTDLEPAAAVEEALRGNGISVESLSIDESVSLTYLTAFPDVEPDHGEVGRAVTTFLELAQSDEWEPTTVEATILRSEGDVQATWRLEADWIQAYNDYTLDDEELSQRVLDTLYEGGDA